MIAEFPCLQIGELRNGPRAAHHPRSGSFRSHPCPIGINFPNSVTGSESPPEFPVSFPLASPESGLRMNELGKPSFRALFLVHARDASGRR